MQNLRNQFAARALPPVGIALVLLLLVTLPVVGEQNYVGRWDAFAGYTYISQPAINLGENGANFQFAFRPKTWVTLGFDYNVATGQNILVPGMLTTSLQQRLGGQLGQLVAAGLVPASYNLALPTNTRTQTFQIGPDIPIRKFESVTLFVRPNLGAMQVVATPRPADPVAKMIVSQLAPSGQKTDWTYFYGFGGGFEYNVTKHFALRFQADFAHSHMFNDLLNAGNTVRFSVGPSYQWGKNVAEH
jgi:hypothetical protein